MPMGKKHGNKKKKKTGLNAGGFIDGNTLLDEKEAAAYLGISPQWLRCSRMAKPAWVGPPFIRVSPHVIRYRVRHLDEFLAARTVDPADHRISAA